MAMKVTILDGYNDEPAGLGVPPYMDIYPRYVAGAFWLKEKDAIIKYYTIDMVRKNWREFYQNAENSDYTIIIAGVVVPGKYLGGKPITPQEIMDIGLRLKNTKTILVGPAAKFGMEIEGGKRGIPPKKLGEHYDAIVKGDPEIFIKDVLEHGFERAEEWRLRKNYDEIEKIILRGTKIVSQHPNFGYNLIIEIETYRGCSRWVNGGCSFCIEPLYGKPIQRQVKNIVEEISLLHKIGVRAFRIGRQSDILVYGSPQLGIEEFPKPDPDVIKKLFYGARTVAGKSVIHIDNVNPGTIAFHEEESIRALKAIVQHHSPGDVAAMGIESADPRVIKINNLNTTPHDALKAIEIVNRIGVHRGDNGLPHLLPGINFILGLPGETSETYRENLNFLEKILEKNLVIRRINIRRVLVLPNTRLALLWKESILRKHEDKAKHFVWKVRHYYDVIFIKKVAPKNTILKNVYIEYSYNGKSIGRQIGSYPLTIELNDHIEKPCVIDVKVIGHKGRSIKGKAITECKLPENL